MASVAGADGRCPSRATSAMRTRPTYMTFVLAFLVGGVGVLALHTLPGGGGATRDGAFDQGIDGVWMGGAALSVIARGVLVRSQRAAWLAVGAGLFCWGLGDL